MLISDALLGWMYLEGKGIPQDPQEAEAWLSVAAELGSALAECGLGAHCPRVSVVLFKSQFLTDIMRSIV